MSCFEINGRQKLGGEIDVHGAKNSVLPILAGTVLINGVSVIHNCPRLSDVDVTIDILRHLGASVVREDDTLIVDTKSITNSSILEALMQEMRSSIIFLGALASRQGSACVYLPGGCEIGLRPIDLHIKGLKALGYKVDTDSHNICAYANDLNPCRIVLPFPSVGATENIILASVLLKGKTTIVNAAREPEISDFVSFLNSAGAKISGASTPVIEIEGVSSLHSCEHTIIPDRILAATLLSAGVITSSKLRLNNIIQSHLIPTLPCFEEMGARLIFDKNSVSIIPASRPNRVKNIETSPYPGFPTDAQAPIMSALSVANGTSVIKETIFENRYKHVSQLNFFGADIVINDRIALVHGVSNLHGANVVCTDLRGGAAVVLQALASEGKSVINDIYHIDRGYENFEKQLSAIGADIKRITYEKGKKKT